MVDDTPQPLGQSAHDQAMIAKADQLNQPVSEPTSQPAPKTRPEHIPEKFWDTERGEVRVEELAKSYIELERARTQPKKDQQPAADASKAAEDAAKAAGADTSKVDFQALTAEFMEQGQLSVESYQKLESIGLNRDIVDQFIAGQMALAQVQTQGAYALVGGEQQYTAMIDWAAKNLSKEEQAAFDRAVTGDAASRKQAIIALRAQYEAALGAAPKLVQGNQSSGSLGAYQSRAELVRDMSDPRYRSDPAFRAQVEQRLAISNVF